jgi:hypothetical protein
MGFFSRKREAYEREKESERQRLMMLSEKELLVEIVLLLEDISMKSDEIQRKQIIFSD